MVHWGWLITTAIGSGVIGFLTCSLFSINKGEDIYYDRIWRDED